MDSDITTFFLLLIDTCLVNLYLPYPLSTFSLALKELYYITPGLLPQRGFVTCWVSLCFRSFCWQVWAVYMYNQCLSIPTLDGPRSLHLVVCKTFVGDVIDWLSKLVRMYLEMGGIGRYSAYILWKRQCGEGRGGGRFSDSSAVFHGTIAEMVMVSIQLVLPIALEWGLNRGSWASYNTSGQSLGGRNIQVSIHPSTTRAMPNTT